MLAAGICQRPVTIGLCAQENRDARSGLSVVPDALGVLKHIPCRHGGYLLPGDWAEWLGECCVLLPAELLRTFTKLGRTENLQGGRDCGMQ